MSLHRPLASPPFGAIRIALGGGSRGEDREIARSARRASRLQALISATAAHDGIGERAAWVITLFPLVLVGAFSLGLAFPPSRDPAFWLLQENRPVELLTFVVLVAAGITGISYANTLRKVEAGLFSVGFLFLFSLCLLAIGGEEVSWGQKFFAFETPAIFREINAQGELTLHNIKALQEFLEILPLAFGLGGLMGLYLARFPALRDICPPLSLMPAFLVIAGVSAIDLFHEFVIIFPKLDILINALDEVIELLVAISGYLFVTMVARRLLVRRSDAMHARAELT